MRTLKKLSLTFLVLLVLLILLPALIVQSCGRGVKPPGIEVDPSMVAVWNHQTEELMQMTLGEYLVGVVAAEMPAQFNIEALKAQAIVARTYTIARMRSRGGSGCSTHPQADICTDSTHCQAWISKEAALAKWPFFRQNAYWTKIVKAVSETQGQVVTCEGKLIDAVFHSTCGGSTENSEDVWTNSFSYLRAVQCGYCSHSPRLTETVTLNFADVAKKLSEQPEDLKLEVLAKTASGRIISIRTGTKTMRGLEFRTSLGLRSSRVTWLKGMETYSFTCTGYGHGVGLCQYGADGMGTQGYSAKEILEYYYTDIQVLKVSMEE